MNIASSLFKKQNRSKLFLHKNEYFSNQCDFRCRISETGSEMPGFWASAIIAINIVPFLPFYVRHHRKGSLTKICINGLKISRAFLAMSWYGIICVSRPNLWDWLNEPLGFDRTPVKNHCFRAYISVLSLNIVSPYRGKISLITIIQEILLIDNQTGLKSGTHRSAE